MITESMLREDQDDLYQELFDQYMGTIYSIYPEEIADYIMNLQVDYYDPGDRKAPTEDDIMQDFLKIFDKKDSSDSRADEK